MASQREIASIVGVKQPTIHSWMKQIGLSVSGHEADLLTLCVAELTKYGLSGPEAAEIVSQARTEISYLTGNEGGMVYLMLFRSGLSKTISFQPAVNPRHLDALLESVPAAQVIALHHLVRRAADHLASLDDKEAA